jgi:hypothetical protein
LETKEIYYEANGVINKLLAKIIYKKFRIMEKDLLNKQSEEKLKEFNVEEYYKNPKRKVITRDGREVEILKIDTKTKTDVPVIAIMDGNDIRFFTTNGRLSLERETCSDLFFADDNCVTCTNDKGCVTCENGELYEGKPTEFKKKLVIIMDSKEGDTKHICNQKSCPFFSKTEDGDMGILCEKLWTTPPKGKSSLASLCNYYDVQNLTIAEAEGCETINQILELSEQHPTDYAKSNEDKTEAKAKEISQEHEKYTEDCRKNLHLENKSKVDVARETAYSAAIEMGQWKNEQMIDFLYKLSVQSNPAVIYNMITAKITAMKEE